MKFLINYDIVLRLIIFISLFFRIQHYSTNLFQAFSLFLILGFLMLFDLLRRFDYFSHKQRIWSLGVSILLGSYLLFHFSFTDAYFVVLVWDIIFTFLSWSFTYILLGVLVLDFLLIRIITHSHFQDSLSAGLWNVMGSDLIVLSSMFLVTSLVAIFSRYHISERVQAQQMNRELKEANEKLRQYSREIEELVVTRERNRLAQEIHDSLGHSMTGLIMHLDFIEKVIEENPIMAKEVVLKCEKLARKGMKEIRLAVHALRENELENEFLRSLENLIENLQTENGLDITLSVSKEVENLSLNVKSVLYRNIQEALTNSIKHGRSKQIFIQIGMKKNIVEGIVQDDGIGSENVQIHNGLRGMQERLQSFGGQIGWKSKANEGFRLLMKFPIGVNSYEEDQSIDCG